MSAVKELFWTSAIIQNEGESKPWLCAISSPQFSLERALQDVEHLKANHNVLCAWVDMYESGDSCKQDEKRVVFHECYL